MTMGLILSQKTIETTTGTISYEIVKEGGRSGFGVVRTVREGGTLSDRAAKFGLTKSGAIRRVLDLKAADAAL